MPITLITLTTDFGLTDHFVGAMKGVIAATSPLAHTVDISHCLQKFDILEAAFFVGEFWKCWPKKTIHVVVVDPGVGSSRRPILLEADGQFFVGPDNGVFTFVMKDAKKFITRELTNDKYFHKPVSRTFHARDIFAPVAAHLAKGVKPMLLGAKIGDALRLAIPQPERTSRRTFTGTILKIDHFGNLITNFKASDFGAIQTSPFEMSIGLKTVRHLAIHYAECDLDELFVIEGSSGYLEVCLNQDSAARKLGCSSGAPVELTLF